MNWMRNYNKSDLGGDFTAGLTVGVMIIPQGMAYAMLAGLPPIYGLYAATIPLIVYALLGTSRQLAVGPVAMMALLISSGVGQLAQSGTPEYLSLVILLAFMVGLFQVLLGIFRLGFLVNYLSHPVISGFTTAAAFIIAFSQLKHLLGVDIPRGKVHETLMNVFQHINDISYPTLILGIISIIILITIKKINRKIPGPLIVVVLGIASVLLFNLTKWGVGIVGDIPSGLPSLVMPEISLDSIKILFPAMLTIAFIGFMESIAVAKAIKKKHKYYELDNNQELLALGFSNLIGSFFQSFPVAGGFGRSAVNDQTGARTGLASLISAFLVVLTLLFLTSYFYSLPKAVLSAIIMVAVLGLVDIEEAKHLWKTDKRDFTLFCVTAVGTLVLGIEEGILMGVVLSLLWVIYQLSNPKIEVSEKEDTFIFKFEERIFFANCEIFKNTIQEQVRKNSALKNIIFDASGVTDMDSSAVHILHDIVYDLKKKNIRFQILNAKDSIRNLLVKNSLISLIGKENIISSMENEGNAALETQKIK